MLDTVLIAHENMLDSTWKKFTSKVKITFDGSHIYEATGSTKVMQVDLKEEMCNFITQCCIKCNIEFFL